MIWTNAVDSCDYWLPISRLGLRQEDFAADVTCKGCLATQKCGEKKIPSRGLTYPPKNGIFEDDFPSPQVGYVNSLEGNLMELLPGTLATTKDGEKKLSDTPRARRPFPYRLRRPPKYWNWEDIWKIYPKQEFIGKIVLGAHLLPCV